MRDGIAFGMLLAGIVAMAALMTTGGHPQGPSLACLRISEGSVLRLFSCAPARPESGASVVAAVEGPQVVAAHR